MKYNFKETYLGAEEAIHFVSYYSPVGIGNSYTRDNPGHSKSLRSKEGTKVLHVLSSGVHNISVTQGLGSAQNTFQGQGMFNTKVSSFFGNVNMWGNIVCNKMHIKNWNWSLINNQGYFNNCIIESPFNSSNANTYINFNSCLLIGINPSYKTTCNTNRCVIYKATTPCARSSASLNLFDSCNITVSQADINTYYSNYYAYNNCKFKIGNEPEYTLLQPSERTEEGYRNEFDKRCTAQGITLKDVSESGETLKQGRWVFANNSTIVGVPIENSIIHNFEKRRSIYFGYTSVRERINISATPNKPVSFNPANPNTSGVVIKDDSISLPESLNMSEKNISKVCSNIYPLMGVNKLTDIILSHNFPREYGVAVSSKYNLSDNVVTSGSIVSGTTYIVRSNNLGEATISYNGATYSSALSKSNYAFKGTTTTTFTPSTNAVVHEVIDEKLWQPIYMRIVDEIPASKITSGNLQAGYWYLVEHDSDQNNTSDYITYNGINYPPLSSFLVDNVLTFSKTGNIHLRRCWKDNFDFNTEVTDKTFWQNKQKPEWFLIFPEDLRCLRKNNNLNSIEMMRDDEGNYIASGNPAFYNMLLAENGTPYQADNIKGSYIQLKFDISTLNPV